MKKPAAAVDNDHLQFPFPLQARLASEGPDRFPAAAANALAIRTQNSRQGRGAAGSGGSSNDDGVDMAPDLYGVPAPGARGRRPRQQPSSSDEDAPARNKTCPGQLRRVRREIDSW